MINTFIYVDALPLSHVDPVSTPFLSRMKNSKKASLHVLENIMGYSFAIQSTILSGELPHKTGHWMPYFRAPEAVSYSHRALARMAQTTSINMFDRRMPYVLRYLRLGLMPLVLFRRGVKINAIPLSTLDRFCTYKYYFMNELPFFKNLEEALSSDFGAKLLYFGPPLHRDPINSFVRYINQSRTPDGKTCDALAVIYVDMLDGTGHEHGTKSKEWTNALLETDTKLEILCRFLVREIKDFNFMIFSDHGTCDIVQTIDIMSYLRQKGINVWKDLTFFIDATLTLLWTDSKKSQEQVANTIKNIGKNVIVFDRETDSDILTKYGVPTQDRKFGDIIVQTRPGFIFFPNFYSDTKPLRGAHGFLPSEEYQRSFLISASNLGSSATNSINEELKPTHIKDIRRFLLQPFK